MHHLAESLYRYKLIRMLCLQKSLETIDEERVVLDLFYRRMPIKLVLIASMVNLTGNRALTISITKVCLVFARTCPERICCFDFR